MSSGSQRLTRSDRVAALELPPGQWERARKALRRSSIWIRILLCFTAALMMLGITHGWIPPFSYRTGYIPAHNITPRVTFEVKDKVATDRLEARLRDDVIAFYANDTKPLTAMLDALEASVVQITSAETLEDLDQETWEQFVVVKSDEDSETSTETPPSISSEQLFADFRTSLTSDPQLDDFRKAVDRAFAPHMKNGLIAELVQSRGSDSSIWVHPVADDTVKELVAVDDVLISKTTGDLEERLNDELNVAQMAPENTELVARLCSNWFQNRGFPTTLKFNKDSTDEQTRQVLAGMKDVMKKYTPNDKIAEAGVPLNPQHLAMLQIEHEAVRSERAPLDAVFHTLAGLGMYVALYVLCGAYIAYHEPRIISDLRQFATLLGLVVITVAACWICARNEWRAESVPIVLFGMILCIAYHRELALLLSTSIALIVVLSLGQNLPEMVILVAATSAAILSLGRVRSRTKLIYVGGFAGFVMAATTIGVGTLVGQTYGSSGEMPQLFGWQIEFSPEFSFFGSLLAGGTWHLFCAILAGILMTGLLPFVEKAFAVQTDLSLLEWGDAAHPLLQQLAQRAPGTYNHSINVASLSEKAADVIGANGLLCRVGAYFHDIGKMLKPGYFIENQGQSANRHDSLVPAMSTLVIIAHVKDGADLARQHGLPQPMIDFIEQHHGTTLVEYFYRQAERQKQEDPNVDDVDESSFRYPGPRPQTREAAVMMLADAVESASRVLTDPSPARIESLVNEIAMKRLMDGQFDECGLTLAELHAVEESLVASLASMYHARVKYPEQPQSA